MTIVVSEGDDVSLVNMTLVVIEGDDVSLVNMTLVVKSDANFSDALLFVWFLGYK